MSVEKLIGSWKLKSKIGSGGNGEVWECTDQTGNAFAMKILTKTTGEAYQRFLDEVKVMLSHQGADGMLPVIDFNLHELNGPEQTEKDLYYVMPLAIPAKERLSRIVRYIISILFGEVTIFHYAIILILER